MTERLQIPLFAKTTSSTVLTSLIESASKSKVLVKFGVLMRTVKTSWPSTQMLTNLTEPNSVGIELKMTFSIWVKIDSKPNMLKIENSD